MSRVLAALAAVSGSEVALIGSAHTMCHSDLRESIAALNESLHAVGVKRAALLIDNSPAWVVADLALLGSGIVNVPVPTYFSATQIQHVLNDAGIDTILTDQPDRVRSLGPSFALRYASSDGLSLWCRPPAMAGKPVPSNTAKITYTSGSTGQPKGVCLSTEAIERVATSLHSCIASLDLKRHLCLLPLPTLLENVAGIYVPLLSGATCCTPSLRDTGVSFAGVDVAQLLRCIDLYRPDSLVLVPELLRILLHTYNAGWRPRNELKFIAVGGARVSTDELARARALGLPVYEGYGLSECASVVCLNTPDAWRIGSVGRPLPHVQLRVDARGELHVRGAVMNGYLGGDAQSISLDEVATGDVGRIDADGYVYVDGRAKDQLTTSFGRNISPEWIESELLKHAAISQVIVLGEAQPHLAALIVSDATSEDIERAVASTNDILPDYARVRSWTRLQESFSAHNGQLTANGRLRRRAIQAGHADVIASLFAALENVA